MKKRVFPFTLVLIAALLLAACGTAAPAGDVTPGAGEVPGATVEATAGVEATDVVPTDVEPTDVVATDVVPTDVVATETVAVEATDEPTTEATSTVAATEAATPSSPDQPEATATVNATPEGGVGGTTGVPAQGNFVRLSSLMTASVTTADSQQAGEVDGLLVEHPLPPVAAEAAAEEGAATPEATPTTAEGPQEFTIRYILVDTATAGGTTGTSRGGNIAVIPWQAFDMASMTAEGLTLNADLAALTGAPRVSLTDIASGSGDWSSEVATFWTDQGVAGIPTTGPAGVDTENLALIPRDFRGITLSDQEGADIGSVADLVVDQSTGVIMHAVFNGGEMFGNRSFVVPMTHLSWLGNVGTQLGSFQFNFPNDALENAPSLESLENLNLDPETINMLMQFWNAMQNQQ